MIFTCSLKIELIIFDPHLVNFYRPRTYVRREVMFSQVCVCSTFGVGGYHRLMMGFLVILGNVCLFTLGGGTPSPSLSIPVWGGGYPIQPWTEGYPNPALDRGGIPQSNLGCGGTLIQALNRGVPWTGGYPIPCLGGYPRYPPPPPPRIASTCYGYAAGGVPLAFTQEDFLVCFVNFIHSKAV